MNPRVERISAEIDKLREKIAGNQTRLRELERLKTELENNDIIAAVRGVDIAPDELAAFMRMFKAQHGSVLPEIDTTESYADRHNANQNQNDKEDE